MMPIAVESYVEICHVINHYTIILDRQSWDDIDQVFTDDAIFDFSKFGMEIAHGTDEIRAILEGLPHDRVHYAMSTAVVGVTESGVEVVTKYFSLSEGAVFSQGEFHDLAVETERGWRLKRRQSFPAYRLKFHSFELEPVTPS